MTNNQGVEDFIKNHPEEFNELVEIFKNLKFDSDNPNTASEEIELKETINILKNKFGLSDFIKELMTKVNLKQLLKIIKNTINLKKEKTNNNLEKDSKSLDNIELEFDDLFKDELSPLKPINTPENNECVINSRSLPSLRTTKNKGQAYNF